MFSPSAHWLFTLFNHQRTVLICYVFLNLHQPPDAPACHPWFEIKIPIHWFSIFFSSSRCSLQNPVFVAEDLLFDNGTGTNDLVVAFVLCVSSFLHLSLSPVVFHISKHSILHLLNSPICVAVLRRSLLRVMAWWLPGATWGLRSLLRKSSSPRRWWLDAATPLGSRSSVPHRSEHKHECSPIEGCRSDKICKCGPLAAVLSSQMSNGARKTHIKT